MTEQNNHCPKTIVFTIARIFFHNKENGRTIMAATRKDGRSCRVIGSINDVAPGDTLQAIGVWKKDEKYGWQFMAEYIEDAINDGMTHALDFSNALNKTYKKRNNVIIDYRYKEDVGLTDAVDDEELE